ncbi:hypothetical protein [Terrarubrum flagellatum]|uniref:hypothetical protein n=1 Tax=Terrirubrum flagellatum TaxID=2895980 RepID=UPI0031455F1A
MVKTGSRALAFALGCVLAGAATAAALADTSAGLIQLDVRVEAARSIRLVADAANGGLELQRAGRPVVDFTAERIAALPRQTIKLTQKTGRGDETAEWSGPLLWDALVAAGVIEADKHAEHVRMVLRARGRDGYVVTLSLSELSPELEGKSVIIATQRDGAALADRSLRLVVPGDRRAGRAVRDLVNITVE